MYNVISDLLKTQPTRSPSPSAKANALLPIKNCEDFPSFRPFRLLQVYLLSKKRRAALTKPLSVSLAMRAV